MSLLDMRFMILLTRLLRRGYGWSLREITLIPCSGFSQDNSGLNFSMWVIVDEELRDIMAKMARFESSRGFYGTSGSQATLVLRMFRLKTAKQRQ